MLAVEYHDFSIQHQGSRAQPGERRGNFRKTAGIVLAVAREEYDPRAFFVGENPIAVVFLFVHPASLVERLGDERGEHGLYAKWDTVLHRLD